MKRRILLVLTAIVSLGLLFSCGPKDQAPQAKTADSKPASELIVSTWGYNEDILRKNVFEPFEKANNVKIILEVGNNSDRLNKVRSMANSDIDLIFLAESFAMEGIEDGLFAEIDRSRIPNIENIYEIAKAPHGEKYGPAYTLNRTGIIYDPAATGIEVKSWKDLWNTKFEANMLIPEITTTAGPALVLAAGEYIGVDPFADSRAVFNKLKELKPNLVKTYSRSSELVNMFTQQEIVIGVAQDFAFGQIKAAVPTAEWINPTEGAFANLNTINIIKGSDQKELAEDFINWWLSEDVQKANALDKIDSPVNTAVILSSEEAAGLTYGSDLINGLRPIDWQKVNNAKAEWIDLWNREVSN